MTDTARDFPWSFTRVGGGESEGGGWTQRRPINDEKKKTESKKSFPERETFLILIICLIAVCGRRCWEQQLTYCNAAGQALVVIISLLICCFAGWNCSLALWICVLTARGRRHDRRHLGPSARAVDDRFLSVLGWSEMLGKRRNQCLAAVMVVVVMCLHF